MRLVRSWATCLWIASSAILTANAASVKPELHHTLFANLPSKVLYLDDTPDVFYHDQVGKNIWRSPDEGKTWATIDIPHGQALLLIEHPYDNKIVFVLSEGTTHYRTMDRGSSWQSFETELPPSISANTLSFHANRWDWILYTGQRCEGNGGWKGRICHDETFYSKDAFSSSAKPLLQYTSRCMFAHDKSTYAKNVPDELVYCVAFEPPAASSAMSGLTSLFSGMRSLRESRLYSSFDFFDKDVSFVDLGLGKEARGVVGIGGVQKYIVTAMKPLSAGGASDSGEMVLYVTEDGHTWSRALFPHGHGLKENAYTIVESTEHSILVDVNSDADKGYGTLFTSNSNGTYFTLSLEYTNRNANGIVDFEKIVGVEGVAIVNTVSNPTAVVAGHEKLLKTRITFDDGGRWSLLRGPSVNSEDRKSVV